MSVGELTNSPAVSPAPAPPPGEPDPVGRRAPRRAAWSPVAWTAGAVLAVVAFWEVAKAVFGVSDTTMPHLWSVLVAFGDTLPNGDIRAVSILRALTVTMQEAAAGLGVGIVIGVVMGVVSAKSRFAAFTLTPVLVATQTLPLVAIVPALVIILGDGWLSLALIAAILAFFPIYVAVARAITDTGRDQRELFHSCGLSRLKVFTGLELPRATLALVGTVRTATALAVVGAIVAELPSGRPSGISMTLLSAASYYLTDPEALWCAAVAAMAGGVALVYLMSALVSAAARLALRIPPEPKGAR
ncbi:MAG: ABC transporter permease subunit [Actinomycetota bacterium]|nr:ABC transporter permease subunit [Actinomycetota bacterium]